MDKNIQQNIKDQSKMRAKITMRTSLDKKYIMAESYAKNPEESTAFGILKKSQKNTGRIYVYGI